MSSLPSSLASWPAFTSCSYMARISSRCVLKRRRTTSAPPSSSTLLLVAVCFITTVTPYPSVGSALQRGAMVLYSGSQGKAAIELLPEHQPRHLVRQREGRERERKMRLAT